MSTVDHARYHLGLPVRKWNSGEGVGGVGALKCKQPGKTLMSRAPPEAVKRVGGRSNTTRCVKRSGNEWSEVTDDAMQLKVSRRHTCRLFVHPPSHVARVL